MIRRTPTLIGVILVFSSIVVAVAPTASAHHSNYGPVDQLMHEHAYGPVNMTRDLACALDPGKPDGVICWAGRDTARLAHDALPVTEGIVPVTGLVACTVIEYLWPGDVNCPPRWNGDKN